MGWGSASGIFNDMADALIESGAPDEVITKTLAKTIGNLRGEDWDTYAESLYEFSSNPAVVEAFRQNKVFLEYCGENRPEGRSWDRCRNEAGHKDDHWDHYGRTWPNKK